MLQELAPASRRLAADPERFRSHVEDILARADREPLAVLVSDRDRRVTASDFRGLVHRLARALGSLGLGVGDRVAILADLSPEAIAIRYAAGLLGCATVCCPDHGEPDQLADFVAQVRADALVVFPKTAAAVAAVPVARRLPRILSLGPVPEELLPQISADLLERAASQSARPVTSRARATDLGCLVSSGGTTGAAKASCRSFAAWSQMLSGPRNPRRRQLVCTPLAYIGQVLVDQTLVGGGSVVLRDSPCAPEDLLEAIETERITHLCLVEPALVALADSPELDGRDLSSLVAISHIGADAAPSLRRRLLGRLGPVLAHPYGASDAGLVSLLAGPDYDVSRGDLLGTAGRLLPGVDVRIELPDHTVAGPYEEGEIVVTSAGVCEGYATDADVGLGLGLGRREHRTGDVGYLDPDGYLEIRGRMSDARTVAGRSVMPVDVQHALCGHPDVRYAVIVPTESGFAALVLTDPQSSVRSYELSTFVRHQHGDSLVPERILQCTQIPVTEQGKPDRAAIARLLEAALGRVGVGTGS